MSYEQAVIVRLQRMPYTGGGGNWDPKMGFNAQKMLTLKSVTMTSKRLCVCGCV